MKFSPLLLLLLSAFGACSPKQETTSTPEAPTTAARLPAATGKTTYQLLQGKWQSTADAKSVIELNEHRRIDYHDGQQLGTAAFVLDRACPAAPGAGQPGDNEKFLVEPQTGMCWEILNVSDERLELSYTARGNTLIYRKIK